MKPRLLIVELHHLGDAVLSIPFVRGAQNKYEVHVLCRPDTRGIYELLETPPVIHPWEPPWADGQACSPLGAITAARNQGRSMRDLDFAAAVCVWADARAAILMAETKAKARAGFPMTPGNYYAAELPWRRRRRILGRAIEIFRSITHPRTPLLTHGLERESMRQPHLRCWEQIGEAMGLECNYSVPWIPAKHAQQAPLGNRPVLAFHPHARLPGKQWPPERWKELLATDSVRTNFDLLEIVPPGCNPVEAAEIRRVSTPDTAALIGAVASADVLLCHDSFPAHLAAALGKPVVTIFGSGEPDWFAPWQNRERVVQRRVCPLHPCIDRCGMDRYICVDAVAVADVLQQLEKLVPTR